MRKKGLNRRGFLKYLGAASAATASAHVPWYVTEADLAAEVKRKYDAEINFWVKAWEKSKKEDPLDAMMWDAMEGDLAWENRPKNRIQSVEAEKSWRHIKCARCS